MNARSSCRRAVPITRTVRRRSFCVLLVGLGWFVATSSPAVATSDPPLGELKIGVPVSGTVVEGQTDRWEVMLEAGQRASLDLIGNSEELWISPVSPNGDSRPIGSTGDSTDHDTYGWNADVSGRWTVEVSLSPFNSTVSSATYTIEFRGTEAVPELSDEFPDTGSGGAVFGDDSADGTLGDHTGWFEDLVLEILALVAPVVALLLVRELTVQIVRSFMMRRSGAGRDVAVGPINDPAAPAVEGPGYPAPEASEPARPLAILDTGLGGGVLLSGTSEERFARTENQLLRTLIGLALSAVAFVALALIVAAGYGVNAGFVASGALVGVFLLLATGWWLRGFGVPIGWISGGLVTALFVASVVGAVKWGPLLILPWVAFAAGVWWTYRSRGQASAAVGKQDLVVLRVFDSDAAAATTFGTLARHWTHLGPVVTVADPSFVRYEYSPLNRANRFRMTIYIIIVVAIGGILRIESVRKDLMEAIGLDGHSKSEQDRASTIATCLLVVPIAAVPVFATVWMQFCRRRDELVRRIDRRLGSKTVWHGAYPTKPFYCFDDLWRPAVERMLLGGEVVLMDLRGFQPKNLGCAYEIGEVIDRVPIHRVVLLLDDCTDRRTVLGLFAERWTAMGSNSPNRNTERAELKMFTAHTVVTRGDGWWRWLRSLPGRQRVWAKDAEKIAALMATAPDLDGIVEARLLRMEQPLPPPEPARDSVFATMTWAAPAEQSAR
jgi:hypothetical protein